jgi:hypothetical protein
LPFGGAIGVSVALAPAAARMWKRGVEGGVTTSGSAEPDGF